MLGMSMTYCPWKFGRPSAQRWRASRTWFSRKTGAKVQSGGLKKTHRQPRKYHKILSGKLTKLLKIAIYRYLWLIFPFKMVIFHSYVGLPEGMLNMFTMLLIVLGIIIYNLYNHPIWSIWSIWGWGWYLHSYWHKASLSDCHCCANQGTLSSDSWSWHWRLECDSGWSTDLATSSRCEILTFQKFLIENNGNPAPWMVERCWKPGNTGMTRWPWIIHLSTAAGFLKTARYPHDSKGPSSTSPVAALQGPGKG